MTTQSVITRATAEALQLVPVGQTTLNHAGGCSQANTYVVNLILPNKVGFAGVLVSECPDVVGDFGAIVGTNRNAPRSWASKVLTASQSNTKTVTERISTSHTLTGPAFRCRLASI